jgi:hypothetical protein
MMKKQKMKRKMRATKISNLQKLKLKSKVIPVMKIKEMTVIKKSHLNFRVTLKKVVMKNQ